MNSSSSSSNSSCTDYIVYSFGFLHLSPLHNASPLISNCSNFPYFQFYIFLTFHISNYLDIFPYPIVQILGGVLNLE